LKVYQEKCRIAILIVSSKNYYAYEGLICYIDEEITPKSFIDLTEEDLRRLNIKTGPRKELLRLITAVNSIVCIIQTIILNFVFLIKLYRNFYTFYLFFLIFIKN